MKKVFIFILVSLIFASTFVFADTIVPGSVDSNGRTKSKFLISESIFVEQDIGICDYNKTVSLYIVEDKKKWNPGDELVDVRGKPQEIKTDAAGKIVNPIRIWENPEKGKYDIVINCDNSGKYNSINDRVDDPSIVGFSVDAPTGKGEVAVGEKDLGDYSWQYDPESHILLNEMLQLNLITEKENILLKNITLENFGIVGSVEKIEVYLDISGNGKISGTDKKIGGAQYANRVVVTLDYELEKNASKNILIAYVMKPQAKGNLSLKVLSLYGEGAGSGNEIKFSGLPLKSGIKTILPAKSCVGLLTLSLPDVVEPNINVTAEIDNLTGCEGMTVKLQLSPCTSLSKVFTCSCEVKGSGCDCSFKSTTKNRTYWACIDKNNDTDMIDFGESVSAELKIKRGEEVEEKEEEAEEGNVTVELTGEAIKLGEGETEPKKGLGIGLQSNTFFVVLEITLILILLILFLIFVTLSKGRRTRTRKNNKSE